MIQYLFARTLGVPDHMVQIVAPDVGGSFGLKIHSYGDEIAAVAAAIALGRPVKFIADRLESFVSDIHARENLGQGAHGRQQVGRDTGVRHRRAVGRRRLLAVSAHQRARGHPDPQRHGRAVPPQAPPGARHRGLSRTSRRPRSIAPSATRSATRSASTWSTARRRRSGIDADRDPAPQRHARRRLPGDDRQRHQDQGPVAPALHRRPGRAHELRGAAQGAGGAARRRASTAASASPASSRATRPARTATTAWAARRSRCRTPAPSSSSPTAASSARSASPSRARAPTPSWARSPPPRSACRWRASA